MTDIFQKFLAAIRPKPKHVSEEPQPGLFDMMSDYRELLPLVDFIPYDQPSRYFPHEWHRPVLRYKGEGVLLKCPTCNTVGDGSQGYDCICGFRLQVVVDGVDGEPKYVLVSKAGE